MFRSALLLATVGMVAAVSVSTASAAKGARPILSIHDAQTGKKIFDDGKLDGKGCVVGKRAVFDPKTGGLKVIPAAKCNF